MADDIRTCADLDERLAPYVDGEDTPSARRAVAGHLGACPSCAGAARDEIAARDLIRDHRVALGERAPEMLRARCARLSTADAQLPATGSQRPAASAQLPASSLLRKLAPLSLA